MALDTFEIRDEEINVEEIMQKIRENIKRRKEKGAYPDVEQKILSLSDEQASLCQPTEQVIDEKKNDLLVWADEIKRDIDYINNNWDIQNNSYFISSHRPYSGKFLIKGRELVHGEVKRYVDPMIWKQKEFNGSVVRTLNEIAKKISEISQIVTSAHASLMVVSETTRRISEILQKTIELENATVGKIRSEIGSKVDEQIGLVRSEIGGKVDEQIGLVRSEIGGKVDEQIGLVRSEIGSKVDEQIGLLRSEIGSKVDEQIGLVRSEIVSKVDEQIGLVGSEIGSKVDEQIGLVRSEIGSKVDEQIGLVGSEIGGKVDEQIGLVKSEISGKVGAQIGLVRSEIVSKVDEQIGLVRSEIVSKVDEQIGLVGSEIGSKVDEQIGLVRSEIGSKVDEQVGRVRSEVNNEISTQVRAIVSVMNQEIENRAWLANILDKKIDNIQNIEASVPTQESELNYFLFEEQFRGSRTDIKQRQTAFVHYFQGCKNVLDIGCGRGEFLELLRENDVVGHGVDVDENMIDFCTSKGLNVEKIDAVSYLEKIEDKSLDGILIDQVVEHLEPNYLIKMLRLCHRKLIFGYHILIETVNPLSFVSFANFYLDMSHKKPIHPETLKFLLISTNFREIDINFFSPVADEALLRKINEDVVEERNGQLIEVYNYNIDMLNNILYGPRDYVIIGKK